MMLILKYFLVVGAVLTLGLIALNAHLLPDGSKAPTAVIHSPTTASLPTVTPNVPPTDTNVAVEPSQPPPAKSASHADRTDASANRRLLTFAEMSHRRNFRRRRLLPERARISLFGRHGSPSWPWRMLLRERTPAVRSPTAGASFWSTNRRPPVRSGFRPQTNARSPAANSFQPILNLGVPSAD